MSTTPSPSLSTQPDNATLPATAGTIGRVGDAVVVAVGRGATRERHDAGRRLAAIGHVGDAVLVVVVVGAAVAVVEAVDVLGLRAAAIVRIVDAVAVVVVVGAAVAVGVAVLVFGLRRAAIGVVVDAVSVGVAAAELHADERAEVGDAVAGDEAGADTAGELDEARGLPREAALHLERALGRLRPRLRQTRSARQRGRELDRRRRRHAPRDRRAVREFVADVGVAEARLGTAQPEAEVRRELHVAERARHGDLGDEREGRLAEKRRRRRVRRKRERRQQCDVDEGVARAQHLRLGAHAQVAEAGGHERCRGDRADGFGAERVARLHGDHRQVERDLPPRREAERADEVGADALADERLAAHAAVGVTDAEHERVQRAIDEERGVDVVLAGRRAGLGVEDAGRIHRRTKRVGRDLGRRRRRRRERPDGDDERARATTAPAMPSRRRGALVGRQGRGGVVVGRAHGGVLV
jgi:hypothetical protein